jgi:glycosyltransferase involved in cell wall biosynthesis
MLKEKPLVLLVCPGLGHINRGLESFTRECFDSLKGDNQIEIYLAKGAGNNKWKEFVAPSFKRSSFIAKAIGKIFGSNSYSVEQFTFSLSLIPFLLRRKPSLIYYSDLDLGGFLCRIRKVFRLDYKLLFSNGTPHSAPYKDADHIQQLVPTYLKEAIAKGEPEGRQTLLPYAFNISTAEREAKIEQKEKIKKELGIASNQTIVLSVGAVNKKHKRMDYVIQELAGLSSAYFLIILGQFDNETAEISSLAKKRLPGRHCIKNINLKEVEKYYAVADIFVLASLKEGFGRVLIEATSFGLTCIVHDYSVAREVLKDRGIFIDMTNEGVLGNCLNMKPMLRKKQSLIQFAYELYSWDKLKDDYTSMILKVI